MGYYDLMGQDYEVLGYGLEVMGDDELLGVAMRPGAPGLQRAAARVLAQRGSPLARVVAQTPAGSSVVATGPTSTRRLPLPVDSGTTAIAAAASTTLTVSPPGPYRPEKFIVEPAAAPAFNITSINIGRKNQILGSNGMAATLFSALNPETPIQFDTAATSVDMSIGVTNLSLAGARFRGAFIGTLVE